MVEGRGQKWNLEDLAAYVVIGLISRIIGFILRTVVIFLGLVSLTITVVGGFVTYLFWVVAPVAIVLLLGFGLSLILI